MTYQDEYAGKAFGGFHQEDMLQYIDELAEDARHREDDLKGQIDNLSSAQSAYSREVFSFSRQVMELERRLAEERKRLDEIAGMRDSLFGVLEGRKLEISPADLQKRNELAACRKEIEAFLQEKRRARLTSERRTSTVPPAELSQATAETAVAGQIPPERLDALYDAVERSVQKRRSLSPRFYQRETIPQEESGYQYTAIKTDNPLRRQSDGGSGSF